MAPNGNYLTANQHGTKGQAKMNPINLGRVTPGQSLDLDALDYNYDDDGSPKHFLK